MNQAEHTGIAVRIMKPAMGYMEEQTRFQALGVPPRSRLYGVEPRSVETVWSECLTSYINRLGWQHGVSPRTLAAQEIGPLLADVEWWRYPSSQLMGVFCAANAMSVNGSGNLAMTWSALLEQVAALLKDPDRMRMPEARRTWQIVRQELNLCQKNLVIDC